MEKTGVIKVGGKRKVSGHQLDHFFCKKKYPLLAYCIFNLVPSGEKCNGSNLKWKNSFTDKHHLNPYVGGFNHHARFVATEVNREVSKIEVKMDRCNGSDRLMQLVGPGTKVDENQFKGNVNVFALESRYNDEKKQAAIVLECVKRANNNMRSIGKYFSSMVLSDAKRAEAHKIWYRRLIRTPFEEDKLGTEIFAKFNRDIHDDYYFNDTAAHNDVIREMIKYTE